MENRLITRRNSLELDLGYSCVTMAMLSSKATADLCDEKLTVVLSFRVRLTIDAIA